MSRNFLGLSKTDTQNIKGAGILMMLFHHLFSTGSLSGIAVYMGVCVALFAVSSGYAFAYAADNFGESPFKTGLKRARHFYSIYMPLFVCVVLLSQFLPPENGFHKISAGQAALGLLGYCPNATITDWWYASFFFAMCLITYPALAGTAGFFKRFVKYNFEAAIILFCILDIVLWKLGRMWGAGLDAQSEAHIFAMLLGDMLAFTPYFLFGFLYYSFAHAKIEIKSLAPIAAAALAVIVAAAATKWRDFAAAAILSALLSVPAGRYIPLVKKALPVFGKYSAYMWLTHRFVFGYWFAGFFHSLNPAAAFALLAAISLAVAAILDFAVGSMWRLLSQMRQRPEAQ